MEREIIIKQDTGLSSKVNEEVLKEARRDDMGHAFNEALRETLERKKFLGLPISKYDREKKKPYLEYPDGRREYD